MRPAAFRGGRVGKAKEPAYRLLFCVHFGFYPQGFRRHTGAGEGVTGLKTEARTGVNTGKRVAIGLLFVTSALIALLGLAFCVYSMLGNVQLKVLSTSMPGAAFGAIIAFLGVRYFLAVRKLRTNVYRVGSRFSWRNFRKQPNH